MYAWLADALADSSQVMTASRRLARVLAAHYSRQQLDAGLTAWRTPAILSWSDWVAALIATAADAAKLPTFINANQSRVLWERCLRHETNDPLLNIGLLARQARDTWTRLHEWSVPLKECQLAAYGADQRMFVRAASNYQSILHNQRWVDPAGLPTIARQLVLQRDVELPQRLTLAGFDRLVPQVRSLLDALGEAGVTIDLLPDRAQQGSGKLHCYDNAGAEMRAAGAWARRELGRSPGQRIAVIVPGLEQDSSRYARLLKEGLLPGWQYTRGDDSIVNVSYGQKLAAYPAISVALLALRWLYSDLATADVSVLLRTELIGTTDIDERSRFELRLRQMADRPWPPQTLVESLASNHAAADGSDWLQRIAGLARQRTRIARSDSPVAWAALFDAVLTALGWPGPESLDSFEFQLINRWRDLLNDLARLELVAPTMTLAEAHGRLAALARETVFQAESEAAVVQLLGPLEAAGMEFDKLWVSGLSAANWPPPGRPLALVSRDLQRRYGMPDADPGDTLQYAQRVIARLVNSAPGFVMSYALTEGDAEQTVTAVLAELGLDEESGPPDPRWYALRMVDNGRPLAMPDDRVPAARPDEAVAGGAMTIQRQLSEPFAAFAYGRLGVRRLPAITAGLTPNIRGNLIHDALHRLYAACPASTDIAGWSDDELARRIHDAVDKAFRPYERHADPILRQLLSLEKLRTRRLLDTVVELDKSRGAFSIASVENSAVAEIEGLRLQLRFDRIDRMPDGDVTILDYKTGAPKRLLDRSGNLHDIQLIVYACAIPDTVAGIGIINIDSRATAMDAAGRRFTPELDWDDALSRWRQEVYAAARQIANGDIRINAMQNSQAARPLGLLSRYRELRRDA